MGALQAPQKSCWLEWSEFTKGEEPRSERSPASLYTFKMIQKIIWKAPFAFWTVFLLKRIRTLTKPEAKEGPSARSRTFPHTWRAQSQEASSWRDVGETDTQANICKITLRG